MAFFDLKTFPQPLTAREEREYLKRYKEGDREAKNVLINRNMRLVAHVIKKYQSSDYEMEDLLSVGTIGLIKAVNTYNMDKGSRLATYAAKCVENEILMHLRRTSRLKLEVSFDEPLNVDWDGNELLLSDILGTENDIVSRDMEDEVDRELLKIALARLTPREKQIVELRFGLNNQPECTQKQVADMLGISQSYISRLEKRIIRRLHKEMARMQ